MNENNEKEIVEITEEHKYYVEAITLHSKNEDGSIGMIKLNNICTNTIEELAIWIGDDEYSYFYICLPTGDKSDEDEDDEVLEAYTLDAFGIKLEFYDMLNWSVDSISRAPAWPI